VIVANTAVASVRNSQDAVVMAASAASMTRPLDSVAAAMLNSVVGVVVVERERWRVRWQLGIAMMQMAIAC
jgi:hypothetical protein